MQEHPGGDGEEVSGLYQHEACALGIPATPGNVMMEKSKVFLTFCVVLCFEAIIYNVILSHFLSVDQLYQLSFILMSSLEALLQYSLRLNLPANTRQKGNTDVYCVSCLLNILASLYFLILLLRCCQAQLNDHTQNNVYVPKCGKDHRGTSFRVMGEMKT